MRTMTQEKIASKKRAHPTNESSHINQSDRRNESCDTTESFYTVKSGYTINLVSKRGPHHRANALRHTEGERSGEDYEVKDVETEKKQRVEADTPSINPVSGSSFPSSTVGKCECCVVIFGWQSPSNNTTGYHYKWDVRIWKNQGSSYATWFTDS